MYKKKILGRIKICVIGPQSNKNFHLLRLTSDGSGISGLRLHSRSFTVCAYICRWSILVYAPAREGWMDGLVHNRSVHSSSTSPSLCATLSLSHSATLQQSGVCCQPSQQWKASRVFYSTYICVYVWRRCFAGKKKRTSFVLLCERERVRLHKGRFVNSCSCDTVNKFSPPADAWLADVFRYSRCEVLVYLPRWADARSWCSFAFRVLEEYWTCDWSGIKCNGLCTSRCHVCFLLSLSDASFYLIQ